MIYLVKLSLKILFAMYKYDPDKVLYAKSEEMAHVLEAKLFTVHN